MFQIQEIVRPKARVHQLRLQQRLQQCLDVYASGVTRRGQGSIDDDLLVLPLPPQLLQIVAEPHQAPWCARKDEGGAQIDHAPRGYRW